MFDDYVPTEEFKQPIHDVVDMMNSRSVREKTIIHRNIDLMKKAMKILTNPDDIARCKDTIENLRSQL